MAMRMETLSKLDSKGRVVIPKKIRMKLGLKKGSLVRIFLEGERIIIEPIVHVKKVKAKALDEAFFDAGEATFGG